MNWRCSCPALPLRRKRWAVYQVPVSVVASALPGSLQSTDFRSRANNFTVDGSDNNDEDIGVRRQGFFSLIPQPIESIQEYQVITLLAPAQFGRNIGAQVNALSKSGTSETHGTIYGFFNSSQLNSRNFFDTTNYFCNLSDLIAMLTCRIF